MRNEIDTIKIHCATGHKLLAVVVKETEKAVLFENERNESIWIPKKLVSFTDDFFNSCRIVKVSLFYMTKLLKVEDRGFFECA